MSEVGGIKIELVDDNKEPIDQDEPDAAVEEGTDEEDVPDDDDSGGTDPSWAIKGQFCLSVDRKTFQFFTTKDGSRTIDSYVCSDYYVNTTSPTTVCFVHRLLDASNHSVTFDANTPSTSSYGLVEYPVNVGASVNSVPDYKYKRIFVERGSKNIGRYCPCNLVVLPGDAD